MSRYWRNDALCRELDPGLFFPNSGDRGARAKQVCAACSVQRECLEFALTVDGPEVIGIFAGRTGHERNRRAAA